MERSRKENGFILYGMSQKNMKPTLSIGIAAYNEAQNIGALISAFLNQKINSAKLMEIIVVSDASTDKTDEIVRSFSGRNVRLIRIEERSGLSQVQNIIMENSTGDILVVSDADMLPGDNYHIENLIAPILADNKVALTAAKLIAAPPKTFVEKILVRSHEFKTELFESIGNGNNIYNCAGPSRAFSRALYEKLRYPSNVPNDAHSFLICLERGLEFKYAPEARAIFRRPSTLTDHVRQSVRFFAGQSAIIDIFGVEAKKAYALPKVVTLRLLASELFLHPILFISYLVILLFVRYNAIYNSQFNSRWDIAITSKRI